MNLSLFPFLFPSPSPRFTELTTFLLANIVADPLIKLSYLSVLSNLHFLCFLSSMLF